MVNLSILWTQLSLYSGTHAEILIESPVRSREGSIGTKKRPVPVYELLDLKHQPPDRRSWAGVYSSVEYIPFVPTLVTLFCQQNKASTHSLLGVEEVLANLSGSRGRWFESSRTVLSGGCSSVGQSATPFS